MAARLTADSLTFISQPISLHLLASYYPPLQPPPLALLQLQLGLLRAPLLAQELVLLVLLAQPPLLEDKDQEALAQHPGQRRLPLVAHSSESLGNALRVIGNKSKDRTSD